MEKAEIQRRCELLVSLAGMLNKDLPQQSVELFFNATLSIPIEQFESGITKAAEKCRFMPSPAEFRELACGPARMPSAAEINAAHRARWGNGPV